MEALGFWIFMSVALLVDYHKYLQGHNSFFFSYDSDSEKEIQKLRIEAVKRKIKGTP